MTADGTIVSSIVDFQTIHAFLRGHVQPLRKKLRMLIAAEQIPGCRVMDQEEGSGRENEDDGVDIGINASSG